MGSSKNRYLFKYLQEDLKTKLLFLTGPRQVGKTTLALSLIGPKADETHPAYLNWDADEDREKILAHQLPPKQKKVVLDEVHKYVDWRQLIKGWYDKEKSRVEFLVTGSARLDYYSKGGDSLDGRYFLYRLHPLSLRELNAKSPNERDLDALLTYGGFPEPFFKANTRFLKRWQRTRYRRILQDDLRDLEQVKEVSRIELLLTHLRHCVGSPLSIENLRKLLNVSHASVERWIQILENLFTVYRISPYGSGIPKIRAVKKEQKLYFWDWATIPDPGARFENLVASQLLKYCHYREDIEGDEWELRFLRDRDSREIDFVVLKNGYPEFAVECKTGDKATSKHIAYFKDRTSIPAFYQVHRGKKNFGNEHTQGRVLPFPVFCQELELP